MNRKETGNWQTVDESVVVLFLKSLLATCACDWIAILLRYPKRQFSKKSDTFQLVIVRHWIRMRQTKRRQSGSGETERFQWMKAEKDHYVSRSISYLLIVNVLDQGIIVHTKKDANATSLFHMIWFFVFLGLTGQSKLPESKAFK